MINTPINQATPLKILQLNLNKSHEAQKILINAIANDYDILLLQEPWISTIGNTYSSHRWAVTYPTTNENPNHDPIRSVIMVNVNLNSDIIQKIEVNSSDITAIKIKLPECNVVIYNLYNDCTHSNTLNILSQHMADELPRHITDRDHYFLFGDFNRHHPMWEAPKNAHLTSTPASIAPLLDIIIDHGLEMLLPHSIPTLEAKSTRNWTRPDNVWRSPNEDDPLISCEVNAKLRPEFTDHLPIITTLHFHASRLPEKARRCYRSVEWDKFRDELRRHLDPTPSPDELSTQDLMDDAVSGLTKALQDTITAKVPISKPLPTTKRWWTAELTRERKERNRLSGLHYDWRGTPDHPCHEEYRKGADEFVRKIRARQEEHYTEWLTNIADGSDLWDVNRFMSTPASDFSRQRIPALKLDDGTLAESNSTKSHALATAFFPPPPSNPIIPFSAPCKPVGSFSPYTQQRIYEAILQSKPHKAPGPDSIPNIVLIKCADILQDHLHKIYEAIFVSNVYPSQWRESITVVLRKPGKPNYTLAGAHRPIALLNTMAKVLSTLVAADLSHITEKYQLVPNNQFGGRPGRSTTEALHLLVQKVKTTWRAHDVVSVLYLDIKAAFPNVVIPVLLNNMRQRGVPKEYINFARSMLTGRSTKLAFDDFTSASIDITNGNGQGCPLSMIFYSFYIAPLLEVARNNTSESAIGFVDDTTLIARAKSFTETHRILKDLMERPGGCLHWSRTHNSQFEISKLAIMDFSHSKEKRETSTDLELTVSNDSGTITTSTIKQSNAYKLLGVRIDPSLNFHQHHDLVLAREVKWTALFRRINRTTKGLSLKFARQLYLAVAIPRITYAADVWYTPPHNFKSSSRLQGEVTLTRKLDSIQRTAAIAITGAMRGTAGDAAAIHADIFSARLVLLDACQKAAARLATRPKSHPLTPYLNRVSKGPLQSHNTTLHTIFHLSDIDHQEIEKIPATFLDPNFIPLITTQIHDDKEEALTWDSNHFSDECMIYTDGSGYENGIGAAAILYQDGHKRAELKYHLGSSKKHTVYEGELVGIILGLHLVKKVNEDFDHVNISLDNQPAIQGLHHRKPKASCYLLNEIHKASVDAYDEHRHPAPTTISATWVPGHSGSKGNEAVDELAKEAATGSSSRKADLPPFLHSPLPVSLASTKQHLSAQIKTQRHTDWTKSKRYAHLKTIDPSLPSRKFVKLTTTLTRAQTSVLTQLRTNHFPTQSYLHRIKKADSPTCTACNEADEDINHFLFICPAYRAARLKIETALKRSASRLETLLAHKDGIPYLLKYVHETGRLRHLSKSLDIVIPLPHPNS